MANPHEDGWEDDGYSSISGATLEKACKELGEDPSTRGQAVKDFREMILTKQKESPHDQLTFERTDRKFLLRFLRARKFDIDRALQLYVNYHHYKDKYAHMLNDFHPHSVRNVLDAGIFGVLPRCLKDGSFVFCVIPSHWKYDTVPPNDPYKAFLLVVEKLLEDEEVQVHGLAVLDNMEHSSVHLGFAFMRAECVKRGALVDLQDSYPLRFKGFHMLHQPWYISMIMKMVRPFLKQKHRDRICAHGSNFSALRDLMDPNYLPANFGGDAPELSPDNLLKFFEHELAGDTPCERPVPIDSDDTSLERPMPIDSDNTPLERPMPIDSDNTSLERVVPIDLGDTSLERPMPIDSDNTSLERVVPIDSGDTSLERPVPIDSDDTPLERPVPIDSGDTPLERPMPIDSGDTPSERPVPINLGDTPLERLVPIDSGEL